MGVEPTAADYASPATGVEDRGAHRDTCLPIKIYVLVHCTGSMNL